MSDVYQLDVASTIGLAPIAAANQRVWDHIFDEATLACLPEFSGTYREMVDGELAFLCAPEPSGTYSEALFESLILGFIPALDGDIWHCWVLSTSGFFPSVYSNFNFNSFAHYRGADYAATEDGVFEIGGDDDDEEAIHAGILFHPTAFRNTSRRKFRKVFVNAEGEGIIFEAKTDTGKKVFPVLRSRANVSRDLRGMRWRFAIADFESFDFFEAFQTVLSR